MTQEKTSNDRRDFWLATAAAAVIVAGGATFYHFVEGLDVLDAVYFCVITLTTVGYGDFSPVTDAGKVFTMFYVIAGIGVLAAYVQLFLRSVIVRRIHRDHKD